MQDELRERVNKFIREGYKARNIANTLDICESYFSRWRRNLDRYKNLSDKQSVELSNYLTERGY